MGEVVKLPQSDERLWKAFLEAKENAIVSGDFREAEKARDLFWEFLKRGEGK